MHTLFLLLVLWSTHTKPGGSAGCTTTTASQTYDKCMTLPSQGASIAWSYYPPNATLDLAFFGSFISPSGWVGVGINPTSPRMTGSQALIAFLDLNSGQIILLPYTLDPSVKLQRSPLLSRPLVDLHVVSSSAALYGGRMATIHAGATVQIRLTIKLAPNKTKIHFVWNRGLYVQGYSPAMHPTTLDDLSSVATVDILSGTASGHEGDGTKLLKYTHGIINAVSWGFMLPAGAAAARYLRHFPSAGPAWFYAHVGVQVSAVLLGTAGFSIGIELGRLSPGRSGGLHRKLGFAALCLGWMQMAALVFRPKATHRFRQYWKSYHHLVGYACVVLGVVNCFEGFEVLGEYLGDSYAELGYSLCVSAVVGVCMAMEVNSWVVFCRKAAAEEEVKRESVNIRG